MTHTWGGCGEVAADQVRRRCRLVVLPGQGPPLAAGDPGQATLTHHPLDALTVDPQPTAAQLGGDPRRPVAAVFGLDLPDQGGELLVVGFPGLLRRFGGQPLVVPCLRLPARTWHSRVTPYTPACSEMNR
jgi:hypothetical protein